MAGIVNTLRTLCTVEEFYSNCFPMISMFVSTSSKRLPEWLKRVDRCLLLYSCFLGAGLLTAGTKPCNFSIDNLFR